MTSLRASKPKRAARFRPSDAPRFALFGETLLVGIAVLVASVPLVTAVPALAAGVRHLRRHSVGESDGFRMLARDIVLAVRRLWVLGVAAVLLAAFLFVDAWALTGMEVPGAQAVTAVIVLAVAAGAVVLLRFVGGWTPDAAVWPQLRRAAVESRVDLLGSVLLLLAACAATVLVWMFPAFLLVAGGLLCLGAYAVDARLEDLAAH
jgi:hypothetical protein